jgi:hypothetical protein
MTDADLLPDDDSFVRTAIQGLRVPTHLPDFWDQLAWRLDDALDEMTGQGLMEFAVPAAAPDLAVPEPSPHHVEDPWPEVEPEPEVDLYGPVDEPVYDDEDDDELVAARPPEAPARRAPLRAREPVFVDAPTAVAPRPQRMAGRPGRVHHDRAVVPMSLRRGSNAVLLALAVLAAAMAVVAGLTLVRQRSEGSAPAPSEQASHGVDLAAPAPPDLAD